MKCLLALLALIGTLAAAQQPIRVWGYDGMKPLMLRWEAQYQSEHPGVRFTNVFHGAAAAPAGLYDGVADIAVLGREWWPVDNMAFHWMYQYAPFGVEVVAAGTRAPNPSFTPVVVVNAANPIESISLPQLDAVFGSEYRAAPANVRTWGELAVRGELERSRIEPIGFGEDEALGVFFRKRVLMDDYKPNPSSMLLQSPHADLEIAQHVARDVSAIGYTSGTAAASIRGVKVIPVVDAAGTQITPGDGAIAAGNYPLSRTLALYVNRKPGERLPADIEGFLLFVLSERGQSTVQSEEGFLPLPESRRKKASERIVGEWTKEATSKEWKQ